MKRGRSFYGPQGQALRFRFFLLEYNTIITTPLPRSVLPYIIGMLGETESGNAEEQPGEG